MSEADKASAVGDEGPDMVGGSAENVNTNQGTASSSAEPMNPLSSQSVTPAVAEDGGCSPMRSLGSPKKEPHQRVLDELFDAGTAVEDEGGLPGPTTVNGTEGDAGIGDGALGGANSVSAPISRADMGLHSNIMTMQEYKKRFSLRSLSDHSNRLNTVLPADLL